MHLVCTYIPMYVTTESSSQSDKVDLANKTSIKEFWSLEQDFETGQFIHCFTGAASKTWALIIGSMKVWL